MIDPGPIVTSAVAFNFISIVVLMILMMVISFKRAYYLPVFFLLIYIIISIIMGLSAFGELPEDLVSYSIVSLCFLLYFFIHYGYVLKMYENTRFTSAIILYTFLLLPIILNIVVIAMGS